MSVLEIACSLALILPALYGPLWMIPVAAIGIAVEMLSFCGLSLFSGDANIGHIVYWLVVAAFCAFIAYGRFAFGK
jgi:hypothetical protein